MALKIVIPFLGAVLLGCTSPNPKSCVDNGFCNDPALPFCDVDGAISGTPETCIAVACEPSTFEACRGDQAISCNSDGTNFDVVQCQLGCDVASGCKLCEPNQTACTNGTLATCDANGAIAFSEKCELGCFDDEPRCRDIDPSNGLSMYADLVTNPEDLDLSDASINTETGVITKAGEPVNGVTSFLTSAVANGTKIRVFVGKNIRLSNLVVSNDPSGFTVTGPAIAFVATGSIDVIGRITVDGSAGGIALPGCTGGRGQDEVDQNRRMYAGNGGGGHATAGAPGGHIGSSDYRAGGTGGAPSGTANLVPLRGGCPSFQRAGGGALQLSSRATITIDGVLDVRGGHFGGAGGGLLLEAANVELNGTARLIAIGGGGGGGANYDDRYVFPPAPEDGTAQLGTTCETPSNFCTAGGNGAAAGTPATPGVTAYVLTTGESGAGGGGGGLGRIRINTRDMSYVKASSAVEAGDLTVGVVGSR